MNENFQNDVNENKASENIVNENETSVENNVVLTSFKKRYFDFIEKAKIDFKQYQFDGVLFMLESEKKIKVVFFLMKWDLEKLFQ
jgi:hypothetical protein